MLTSIDTGEAPVADKLGLKKHKGDHPRNSIHYVQWRVKGVFVLRSIYRWDEKVHDETEARVALHTRRSLVSAIVDRAKRDHPYDVPCVIGSIRRFK